MQQPQMQERCTLKLSTRNPSNIQSLRSDKRFEALVKQEMIEHQNIISSHHKEMQSLREALILSMERSESLAMRNTQELEEFKIHTGNFICFLKDKIHAHEEVITEQKKTIDSLHHQLNEFHECYASKSAVERIKEGFRHDININTTSHINSFQEFQRELKTLMNVLQNDVVKLSFDVEQKMAQLVEKIESNFNLLRLDKEGLLREIRIYEKTIFIIEKKIENIYTLIERINRKEEICHRQE